MTNKIDYMTNASIAFDVMEEGESPPRVYNEMVEHMILDVNLDAGFTHKSRFVAYRHKVKIPPLMTYE